MPRAATLFADDPSPADAFDLGSHTVSVAELTQFAGQWDPQFFHVDAAAADRGMFGGLIASGILTMAVFQRLSVEGFWGRTATVAARGMRDVRFVRPVRPGASLAGSGEPVLTMTVDAYLARRPATT